MGRQSTLPTLFDEIKYISITKLKEWGYLELQQFKSGEITWSRNGNKTGCISITVNFNQENPYLELDYKFNGEPQKYKVPIVSIPSNLGNGLVYYFQCPFTEKQCRKLYSIGKLFLHREAAKGYFYEKQTYSAKSKYLNRLFDGIEAREKIYHKYFKRFYNERPTKKYLKLQKQIFNSKGFTEEMLLRLKL